MSSAVLRFLSSRPPFDDLPADALALLADGVETVAVAPGDVVFREGAAADAFFVVQDGILEVEGEGAPTGPRPLGRLGVGDIVGELALARGAPRGATVRAATGATVLRVSRALLESVAAIAPQVRQRLADGAARRLPSLYLASVPLFAGIGAEALRAFDDTRHWMSLAGGDTLFAAGDPAEDLYVIVRGRLEVVLGDTEADVVTHLAAGDVVGEIGVLTGAPRNATVRAVRDTDLVRLSRADLYAHIEQNPQLATAMLRTLAARVTPVRRAVAEARFSTVALVSTTDEPLDRAVVARLVESFGTVGGPTMLVDAAVVAEAFPGAASAPLGDAERLRLADWLHEQEARVRHVVFDCGSLPAAWVTFALRQSDMVMLVAPVAADPARIGQAASQVISGETIARATDRVLVLLHDATTSLPSGTARWLDRCPVLRHHHVRVDRAEDYRRVARFVAGKAVGVAMSGGGARTLAHLGVLSAMHERGLPLDMVGGVSAGVLTASYCALGHDAASVQRLARENAGNYDMLRDATLPIASFMNGRHLNTTIMKMYGQVLIEDLWLPYFCLSANLTTASIVVHDRGPLWLANRASMAVPGIITPVAMRGDLLVDGGVLNNLPVDVMRARCPGVVVAADVSLVGDLRSRAEDLSWRSGWSELWARLSPFGKREPILPNVFEILARTATLSSIHHGGEMAQSADIYVRTPTTGVATFDWDAGLTLVDKAHGLALEAIDGWRARTAVSR